MRLEWGYYIFDMFHNTYPKSSFAIPRHTYLKSTSLSDPKTSRLDWVCLHHLSARIYRKYIIFNDLLLSLSQKLSGQRASGIGRSVSVRNQTVVKHQCQKLTNPKNGL